MLTLKNKKTKAILSRIFTEKFLLIDWRWLKWRAGGLAGGVHSKVDNNSYVFELNGLILGTLIDIYVRYRTTQGLTYMNTVRY